MFLKRLDVVGFKSFAEKISIDFVPGVTAVVGPNGSGKSNVTDAIRWVLGEQSAKSLRGTKMEDIIFSGSDSRKPLNFAEVSLTLDNSANALPIDFHEVSVTRRVYRSGESEFFINNGACRLKDIIELFMDSGLGREAFSIISQGKVEEILSSKAEERRVIFDEAAGVLKYKTRKKKAEQKLNETQENVTRVQDILFELEGQVEPLKMQASLANEFLAKKEELEQFEVSLTVYEIEELHHKWERLSRELEEHTASEQQLAMDLEQKQASLQEYRQKMTSLDSTIDALQEVLLTASQELEKVEGRKDVLKERKKNASQHKAQLEKAIAEAEMARTRLVAEKEEQKALVHMLQTKVEDLQSLLQEKQKALGLCKLNLDETIDVHKSDYIEWLNKQATAKNEKQYLWQQLDQHDHKNTRLDQENAKYLTDRTFISERKQQAKQKMRTMTDELEQHVQRFRTHEQQAEKAKAQYQQQETMLYKAYQFLQQAKSRKEVLEEMEEEYAGFFQGVKEILKAKSLSGIEGAVAELIKVPKEYQVAVEIALGAAMQHVVVEKEEHARQAIGFLKKNGYGRATFLPLSVIKGRDIPLSQLNLLQNHVAYIGTAAELIQFDATYAAIVTNLLGTVLITRDLKGANELAKVVGHRYRFVTLEGDVVNPGGSMTGGASKQKTSSLLSRKVELDELKSKLADMELKTSQLEKQVRQAKGYIVEQDEQVAELRQIGATLREKEQLLKSEWREIELQEKNINDRLHLYDLDKKQLMEEQQQKTARLEEIETLLAQCALEINQLDHIIAELTEQKQRQQSSRDILVETSNELKVSLASKREQLRNQKEQLQRLEEEWKTTENKLVLYQEDLALLIDEMSDRSSGEDELANAALRMFATKNETIENMVLLRQEKEQLQKDIAMLEIEVKERNRQYKGFVETVKDEEVKLNRLDVALDNRLDTLREDYFLSYEAAKEKYPLTLPVEEAKKRVKLIKLAIDELGTVNLGAIEEYERVFERYEFLVTQKSDLQQAKDTLVQVINEMDEEMTRRFADTFYAIRDQFETVFKALFGGGRAELKLTDPLNLLQTGVEIVAQPPGKKLKNLSLLSGGERALTAIALLFSILKVRPVPFCILDEVEAALDEANVMRFSQFLKAFSQETQFIVITHRKGTMEGADVLYGITMQESGVSRLVSVRLEETAAIVK